jgi:hypothetical protein
VKVSTLTFKWQHFTVRNASCAGRTPPATTASPACPSATPQINNGNAATFAKKTVRIHGAGKKLYVSRHAAEPDRGRRRDRPRRLGGSIHLHARAR